MSTEDDCHVTEAHNFVAKWMRRTVWFGIGLAVSIVSSVPFLYGHSLHRYFEAIGKYLIYGAMCFLTLFMGCDALTFNYWMYWRSLRKESSSYNGLNS